MKQIVFTGKKGKQMKNIFTGEKTEEVKREVLPEVPITLNTVKSQYNLLCELHFTENSVKSQNQNEREHFALLNRELNAKMNGYKQQDVKKKLFDNDKFIKIEEIRQKLIDETLTCVFCNKQVKLLYDKVRDEMQWTLDRIDNDLGHTNDNTRIACLKCNLKRRRTDYDKFHWTKNLAISKLDNNDGDNDDVDNNDDNV